MFCCFEKGGLAVKPRLPSNLTIFLPLPSKKYGITSVCALWHPVWVCTDEILNGLFCDNCSDTGQEYSILYYKSSRALCTYTCTLLCCVLCCQFMYLKVHLNSKFWLLCRIFGDRKNFVCDYSLTMIKYLMSI